jgi:cytochrome c oxidase subunit 2
VPLSDGTLEIADERYIRDSILKPRAKIAAGYEPLMPSYEGKISEDEMIKIVAYIKSIGGGTGAPQ